MTNEVYLGLSNTYGCVMAYEKDGKFFMSLSDYRGRDVLEVSEAFFRAIEKEFGE